MRSIDTALIESLRLFAVGLCLDARPDETEHASAFERICVEALSGEPEAVRRAQALIAEINQRFQGVLDLERADGRRLSRNEFERALDQIKREVALAAGRASLQGASRDDVTRQIVCNAINAREG